MYNNIVYVEQNLIEENSIDLCVNYLHEISFSMYLFTFIFVAYFLYIFLKDTFIKR